MFDQVFGLTNRSVSGGAWSPAVDLAEDAKSFTIVLEAPGVKADEIKVQIDGNRLTISGEKKATEGETDRVLRFERRFGAFVRAFILPETVDTAGIQAAAKDGVLRVTLPKLARAEPKVIPVAA
jgi:HSP20 family protein